MTATVELGTAAGREGVGHLARISGHLGLGQVGELAEPVDPARAGLAPGLASLSSRRSSEHQLVGEEVLHEQEDDRDQRPS